MARAGAETDEGERRGRARRRAAAAARSGGAEVARVSRGPVLWIGAAIALCVVAIYAQVAGHRIAEYDSAEYLTRNGQVQSGLTASSIAWAFTSFHAANWHPLTWLSHMLDVQLFGLRLDGPNPGHHLHALLLHVLNTLLVYALFVRWTASTWKSALVAALFGLHPMHVESVAWVIERKDVLSTFYGMAFLHAWTSWTRKPRIATYALAWVLLALGLMAKSMLITLPCVLFLLDAWPLARTDVPLAKRIVEKLPFVPLMLASAVLTSLAQKSGGAMSSIEHIALAPRVANAVWAWPSYAWKLVWPTDLIAFYPWRDRTIDGGDELVVAACALVILAITAWAFFVRRSAPYLLVGWLWFLGTLVPVIGLVQVGDQSMADRYSYLPSIGFFAALVWGVDALLDRMGRARAKAALRALAIALVVVACIVLGWKQVAVWKDTETLGKHGLAIDPTNYRMHGLLGWVYADRSAKQDGSPEGRKEAARLNELALVEYRAALSGHRTDPGDIDRYGYLLCRMGRFDEAEPHFRRALELDPDNSQALNHLGAVYTSRGDWKEAERWMRRSVEVDPTNEMAANNLGFVLEQQGRLVEAEASVRAALADNPKFARALLRLGVLARKQKRLDEAAMRIRQAMELGLFEPDLTEARNELAGLRAAGVK